MHEVKVKGILSAKNGMNLYRGCSHGCIYCDSRSRCYQMNHAFEDIEVKINALELLEEALARKRSKCMIGTGAMSDPYLPLEQELQHTRGALELISRYRFGATLITKSDLVLRDMDLLEKINRQTRAVVQMTLTTWDDRLCKILEPGVCPSSRRFQVLKEFQKAGIPTVVWLTPILPYINDTEENLRSLLDCCVDAGVSGIFWFGAGVTLREGSREYFYRQLDRHFPGMKERYMLDFGNRYVAASPLDRQLTAMVETTCRKHDICCDLQALFQDLQRFDEKDSGQQLTFLP